MEQQQDNPKKYDCADVEQLAQKYIDNQLNEEERRLFDAHLEYCLPCDKKIQLEYKLKEILKIKAKNNLSHSFTAEKVRSLINNIS